LGETVNQNYQKTLVIIILIIFFAGVLLTWASLSNRLNQDYKSLFLGLGTGILSSGIVTLIIEIKNIFQNKEKEVFFLKHVRSLLLVQAHFLLEYLVSENINHEIEILTYKDYKDLSLFIKRKYEKYTNIIELRNTVQKLFMNMRPLIEINEEIKRGLHNTYISKKNHSVFKNIDTHMLFENYNKSNESYTFEKYNEDMINLFNFILNLLDSLKVINIIDDQVINTINREVYMLNIM